MALTPEDVRNISFRKPPLGRRGYDEEGVDAFLDEVAKTLTELYAQQSTGAGSLMAPLQPQVPPDTTAAALTEIKATLARIEARLGGNAPAGGSFF